MMSAVVFLLLYPFQGSFLKIVDILGSITYMQTENLWQGLCFFLFQIFRSVIIF